MDLNNFINSIEKFSELDNKDQIPYLVYFLINKEELDGVTQGDIRNCYSKIKIHLSINLSIYFRENTKKRKGVPPIFIKKKIGKKEKYLLESKAEKEIEKNLKIKTCPNVFLIESNMGNKFYDRLIWEINYSYHYEIYTGCFILARKLFENMLIDILRNKFSKEKHLFQNLSNKKIYNNFSILLNNLETKKSDLGFTTTEIEKVINKLNPYRIEANSKAHSITDFGSKKELEKYEIAETFDLLNRIWKTN